MKIFKATCLMLLLISGAIAANAEDAQKIPEVGSRSMRHYPSIFQAWSGIENRPDEDEHYRLARHELAFAHPYTLLKITWNISQAQPYEKISQYLSNSR